MINLKNKKILVMGASGGVGSATAETLSRLGADVIISGRNKNKLQNIYSKLQKGSHHLIEFDINQIDKISEFLKNIVALDGRKIDGLVYSSGVIPLRPIKNTTYDFILDIMKVNFFGFVEIVRAFSHKKITNGGSIVVLSSYAAINGDKGQLAYSSSKGAIDSSVIVLAKELYQKKIRVNAVRPAVIGRDGMDINELPSGTKSVVERMRTGPIEPDSLSELIAFLLSDSSSGVYGRCFDVRGYLS